MDELLLSPLQKNRIDFTPKLPALLERIDQLRFSFHKTSLSLDPSILSDFPLTSSLPLLYAERGSALESKQLKVGVVFSGGQAPGGHNVIAGLFDALQKIDPSSLLYGFLDGPAGVINNRYKPLTEGLVHQFRNLGGFDLLGSGRDKIETKEQLQKAYQTIKDLDLDALVIIGGDDSNTNAAVMAEYLLEQKSGCSVVGVPKTIDGDLQNSYVPISFGFDSACRVYSELIGNIAKDALSSKKYYHFIKLMGRSASHITLECALSTRANLSLIGEEIAEKNMSLADVVYLICDMICKRAEMGKNYGVILIPEGLVEFIPEMHSLIKELSTILVSNPSCQKEEALSLLSSPFKECFLSLPDSVQKQLLLERDPHGNVQLSHIETEKMLSLMVMQELQKRKTTARYKGKFSPLHHYLGYEGRSGMPTNFDAHYCYALGFASALLIREKASGYMCFVSNLHLPVDKWTVGAVPLVSLMHREERKGKMRSVIKKSLVEPSSSIFKYFISVRDNWMMEDLYLCPGPTQYFGPESVSFIAPQLIMKF